MNERQFKEITQWQKETFPLATVQSKLTHLHTEVEEVMSALHFKDEHEIKLEFADCFILLFGAAASYGLNYKDIQCVIEEKMLINSQRKWGEPDENGVVNHIKE